MSFDWPRPSKVIAALNHAARTFQSFSAADWRDMAAECTRQADKHTCVDCGVDQSINAPAQPPSDKRHTLRGDRWSCRR